ncbi:REI1 [Sanghuangporus vaninii]
MGVGAVFISTLAISELPVPSNPPATQNDLLATALHPVVSFVVLGSIIIHGLSISVFCLGKNTIRCTLSLATCTWTSHEGTNPGRLFSVDGAPVCGDSASPLQIATDIEQFGTSRAELGKEMSGGQLRTPEAGHSIGLQTLSRATSANMLVKEEDVLVGIHAEEIPGDKRRDSKLDSPSPLYSPSVRKMAAVMQPTTELSGQPLFTCLSCSIAFPSAEDQRLHYRSDHHRYNMKRRVANLPPVSATVFNQKVLERRQETAIMSSPKGSVCEVCNKIYTTENAYRSHINSKKHKENELKATMRSRESPVPSTHEDAAASVKKEEQKETEPKQAEQFKPVLTIPPDATEEQIVQTIDEKIAAARTRLSPRDCLFCSDKFSSLEENLTHMSTVHSFFVPDADYLVDLPGLITYLGEKIAIGNVCIYCNLKSRDFRSLEAVRKHMIDKSHCKMAYDIVKERLEYADFYDFSSSYPDYDERKNKRKEKISSVKEKEEDEEWEDMEDDNDEEVDEVVEEEASSDEDDEEILPGEQLTYGDTTYELVLPSGARIGHRSMRRYYAQSFPRNSLATLKGKDDDPNTGAALVRRLLADKNSALVPRKGGFGAYGSGTDVVKARNRGEAREAGRHVREFRDQRRREDFKTRVAFRHNHQKHYRDPLLQVSPFTLVFPDPMLILIRPVIKPLSTLLSYCIVLLICLHTYIGKDM